MKKVFAKKKLLLLSFLIPFALATAGYHLVYVSDAGRGAQGYSIEYPNIPVEQALKLEKNKRWLEADKWLVHMLIFGAPAGFLGLAVLWTIETVRDHSRKSG
jgi:hypothetical protein